MMLNDVGNDSVRGEGLVPEYHCQYSAVFER